MPIVKGRIMPELDEYASAARRARMKRIERLNKQAMQLLTDRKSA